MDYLISARAALAHHLTAELIPFWLTRSVDAEYGGYLTSLDAAGERVSDQAGKFFIMQVRMVWSFARFSRYLAPLGEDVSALQAAARQGVDFLLAHMWDAEHGGWYELCAQDGSALSTDKVIYAHSFAIYGLAEYTWATGDSRGLECAGRTFDLLQRHAADLLHGGYIEYFARDWTPQAGDHFSSTRKTMNTHMHLMEAFTTLAQVSGDPVHARHLQDLVTLITTRLIDSTSGAGHDWFDLDFTPLPTPEVPLPGGEVYRFDPPAFLQSYGHDVELAWLLIDAGTALGQPRSTYQAAACGLVDHALAYGLDRTRGGLYHTGIHSAPAVFKHKEWWQQAEALVAFLDLYALTQDDKYLEAFRLMWEFADQYVINHAVGEWRAAVAEDGTILQGRLGDMWKGAYHTGRALIESLLRIDMILKTKTN